MVDNINPNSQFHPYQPVEATPVSERVSTSGLGGLLKRIGISDDMIGSMRNTDVRGSVDKVRGLAQKNPGMVLGGLAALAIGAGLMRRRS